MVTMGRSGTRTSDSGLLVKAVRAFNVIEWVHNMKGLGINPIDSFTCAPESWGAYKTLKAVFRVVVEMESGR